VSVVGTFLFFSKKLVEMTHSYLLQKKSELDVRKSCEQKRLSERL